MTNGTACYEVPCVTGSTCLFVRMLCALLTSMCVAKSPTDKAVEWPFDIQPDGLPVVKVGLFEFNRPEFTRGISIGHEIYSSVNGMRSVCYLTELSSELVSVGKEGQFRWRDVNGFTRFISESMSHNGVALVIDGEQAVISDSGLGISFRYNGSRLVEIMSARSVYNFVYSHHHLPDMIVRSEGAERSIIMKMEWNLNRKSGRIQSSDGRQLDVYFDENGSLVEVRDPISGLELFQAEYNSKNLLERLSTRNGDRHFDWGRPVWRDYDKPIFPLPLVVTETTYYRYSYIMNGRRLYVRVTDTDGRLCGSWVHRFGGNAILLNLEASQ